MDCLAFHFFQEKKIARTPFKRARRFGEAGGGWLVCLFVLVFVLALTTLASNHCIHGRIEILFVQNLCSIIFKTINV